MSRLAIAGMTGAVICIAAAAAPGDAASDYAAIFGREAGRVAASSDRADDAAFAKKLLESAASVSESPKLQVLLYERAYEFAARSPDGLPTALQALTLLEQKFPDRKADWQAKRLALLRNQHTRARGEAKKAAGQAYMEALLAGADAMLTAGQADKALAHYRSARGIATYYRLEVQADINRKIAQASAAVILASKIRALQSRIAAHPDDTAAREDLILLHVVQQDAPAKARQVLTDSVSAPLRENVRLAERSVRRLSATDALRLGEWYFKTLLPGAGPQGLRSVLERAERYYEHYLARRGALRQEAFRQATRDFEAIEQRLREQGLLKPGETWFRKFETDPEFRARAHAENRPAVLRYEVNLIAAERAAFGELLGDVGALLVQPMPKLLP